MSKKKAAVIGCTGMAGQQFIEVLDNHPWFEIESLHGESSNGFQYKEKRRGFNASEISDEIKNMEIQSYRQIDFENVDLIFSAIPSSKAEEIESYCAKYKPVFSTASYFRYQDDVPIFLPIVNGSHYPLFKQQRINRNWEGYVCPGPNCTSVGLAITLYPIFKEFGLMSTHMVSLQALSGAGYPGVPSFDLMGNVIPHIEKEEEKVQKEIKKILGTLNNYRFEYPDFSIDAKCNRVPVLNGHIESVFIQTEKNCSVEEITECLAKFEGETKDLNLPNAPDYPIYVFDQSEPYRPQPRIEFEQNSDHLNGMKTYVGGIQNSSYENGFKMTILSHNTELGAGRGSVLSAEYLFSKNLI